MEKELLEQNRKIIQLIDVGKLESFEQMTEMEKREYAASASELFNNKILLDILRWLAKSQLEFVFKESQNWEQVLMGRGNINGIGLVFERLQFLQGVYQDYLKSDKGELE
ncbi:MAG: hypothetical protein AABY15_08715 [Nanoarchaeota archaeon]